MANTMVLPQVVANRALFLLINNLVGAQTMDKGWQPEFNDSTKKGDSIKIRRRDEGTVRDFTSTITKDDVNETSVYVTLEKMPDSSSEVTSKDLTLNIEDFVAQFVEPKMVRMAEFIDTYCLSKFAHIPTVAGLSNAAPAAFPTTVAGVAADLETADNQKIPQRGRVKVISPALRTAYLGIPEYVSAEKRGDQSVINSGNIGNVLGIDHYVDQNIDTSTFTSGTMTSAVVNGDALPGATSIIFDGASGATHTLKAGDILTIAGYGNVTVAANVTASSSAGTVTIRDPLRTLVADNAVITVYDGGGNTRKLHGAIYNPSAFAFVSVPLALPDGAVFKARAIDPYTGISIRIVKDYDINTKKEVMSMDCLVGCALVEPRLAAQIVLNV